MFDFVIIKNRIPALRRILLDQRESGMKQEVMEEVAKEGAMKFLAMIRQAAPVGEGEPPFTVQGSRNILHGRPSMRLHGRTLEQSWENPQIRKTFTGADFIIGTSTRLYEILFLGARRHKMPTVGGPFMSFWWKRLGRPAIYNNLAHPGFPPRNWVEREYLFRGQTLLISLLNKGLRQLLQPIKDFFS